MYPGDCPRGFLRLSPNWVSVPHRLLYQIILSPRPNPSFFSLSALIVTGASPILELYTSPSLVTFISVRTSLPSPLTLIRVHCRWFLSIVSFSISMNPSHWSSICLRIFWVHKFSGSPRILTHTQSLFISAGQQPEVGVHHSSTTLVFFHSQTPLSTCYALFLDGNSKRKSPSFIAWTLTLTADFHELFAHPLASFRVGGSCDWNLPTKHLPKRSFSNAVMSSVISMLASFIWISAFFEAAVAHLLVLQPLWRTSLVCSQWPFEAASPFLVHI